VHVTRFARSAAAVVSILCAGVSASAQLTEKQAQRQLAAASRAGLASYKQQLAASRAEIEANLDAFELVLAGTPVPFDVLGLFADLSALQDELAFAAALAFGEGFAGAGQALVDLRGGGPSLNGIFPQGFYVGDGGTIDRHRAQILARWDRFYAQLERRLARTRKLAERSGLGLTIVLARSGFLPGASWADGGLFQSTGVRPLTVDTLVAASLLANGGDGLIAVGGQADDFFGAVSVAIHGVDGTNETDSVFADASSERWAANTFSDFSMAPLPEGTFYVTAQQAGGSFEEGGIGIR
jgi:hypothetical protein